MLGLRESLPETRGEKAGLVQDQPSFIYLTPTKMKAKTKKRYVCMGCGNEIQEWTTSKGDIFPHCKICKRTCVHIYITDKPKIKSEPHIKPHR